MISNDLFEYNLQATMNVKAMTLAKNKFLALLEKYPKIKDEFLENE